MSLDSKPTTKNLPMNIKAFSLISTLLAVTILTAIIVTIDAPYLSYATPSITPEAVLLAKQTPHNDTPNITLTNASGFIDLNTSNLEIIAALAEAHTLPAGTLLRELVSRRREGRRFTSVAAFARLPLFNGDLPQAFINELTVHSGRAGIAVVVDAMNSEFLSVADS